MKPNPFAHRAAAIFASGVVSCGKPQVEYVPDNNPEYFVDADGGNITTVRDTLRNRFPHLLMQDGQMSLNDRCPVRKIGLNRRLPPLFVNGRPIGFC